jgi:hypothetical protein
MTRKIVAWEVSNDDHAVIVLHSNGLAARPEDGPARNRLSGLPFTLVSDI